MTVLAPMRPDVFAEAVEASIAAYAEANVAAGRWPEEGAPERSRSEWRGLLPQGLATPGHHWFEIRTREDGPAVGHLWFAMVAPAPSQPGPPAAFVYDIQVRPAHRRQGHARRAFAALESLAAAMGARRIDLHVFAFNAAARALYRSLGYAVTSLDMGKPLETMHPPEPGGASAKPSGAR